MSHDTWEIIIRILFNSIGFAVMASKGIKWRHWQAWVIAFAFMFGATW